MQIRGRTIRRVEVALFGVLVTYLVVLIRYAWLCDDAYITFRHAKNLVEAGRPAWNLTGDPVLGSTSPVLAATEEVGAAVTATTAPRSSHRPTRWRWPVPPGAA